MPCRYNQAIEPVAALRTVLDGEVRVALTDRGENLVERGDVREVAVGGG